MHKCGVSHAPQRISYLQFIVSGEVGWRLVLRLSLCAGVNAALDDVMDLERALSGQLIDVSG